jgi:hypothetical protein
MYINAAEYLQEIRAGFITLHNRQRDLKNLESMLEAKAITYNPDRINTTPRKDGLEELALKHLKKRDQILTEIDKILAFLYQRIDEASQYISEMDSEDQQEVLRLRYLQQRSWSEILEIRECDDISSQYKIHKRALESLQRILNNHCMTIE